MMLHKSSQVQIEHLGDHERQDIFTSEERTCKGSMPRRRFLIKERMPCLCAGFLRIQWPGFACKASHLYLCLHRTSSINKTSWFYVLSFYVVMDELIKQMRYCHLLPVQTSHMFNSRRLAWYWRYTNHHRSLLGEEVLLQDKEGLKIGTREHHLSRLNRSKVPSLPFPFMMKHPQLYKLSYHLSPFMSRRKAILVWWWPFSRHHQSSRKEGQGLVPETIFQADEQER